MGWTSEEEVPAINITWDGNTEGLEVMAEEAPNFFMVSNTPIIVNDITDLIGTVITITGASAPFSDIEITSENIGLIVTTQLNNKFISINDMLCIVAEDNLQTVGFTVAHKGIYFLNPSSFYVSSFTKEATTQEVVHQIDEKYIPSSGGGAVVVNVTVKIVEDQYVVTADKTYDEINNAFLSGVPIIAKCECDDISSIYHGAASNALSKMQMEEIGVYCLWFSLGASGVILCLSTNEWALS